MNPKRFCFALPAWGLYSSRKMEQPKLAKWTPASWQDRTAAQQPTYGDRERLDSVLEQLGRLPPIVTSWEIETLKEKLAAYKKG